MTEILHVTLFLTGKAHIVIEMLHITLALTGEIYRYNMTEMLHVITDNWTGMTAELAGWPN